MEKIIAVAKANLLTLQKDGVDDVMFSNEPSLPYLAEVEPVTIATMARVAGELKLLITVPYDVNCLWDPIAPIDLVVAVDGKLIREIISSVYASDFRLWNTNVGKAARHKIVVGAKDLKLLFDIVPEAARCLAGRDMKDIARSTELNDRPDVLCVSGLTAGSETDTQILGQIRASVKRIPILCGTGCSVNNITRQLSVANGAVCTIILKYDGVFENTTDVKRVKELMNKVKKYRVTF